MITMKMNMIDSTESTDTMTFINNEQSIIVNLTLNFQKYLYAIFGHFDIFGKMKVRAI